MDRAPITDEQLDSLIESNRQNFRTALRACMESLQPIMWFEIAKLPLPSGEQWQVGVAIALEPMAQMMMALSLQGMPAMEAAYRKLQTPQNPPQGAGFTIPSE